MLLTSSDNRRTLMHVFLLQSLPRENWFQYVRRVYPTPINFPCITPLAKPKKTVNKPVEIYRVQEERNQTLVLNTDLSAVSSPSGSDMEIEKEKRKEEESDRRENSTESQISQSYEEEVENDENSTLIQR